MKFRAMLGVVAAASLVAGTLHAADCDAAAGKQKTTMCAGCHGIPGYQTSFPQVYSVPRLGGQHAAYIVKALQAYKAKERSHPTMQAIAAGLSDKDMADLAAYYATDTAKTATK